MNTLATRISAGWKCVVPVSVMLTGRENNLKPQENW